MRKLLNFGWCGMLLWLTLVSSYAQVKPKVEFFHFWISPGEQAAMGVLRDAYQAQGGEWYDTASPDYERLKHDALTRISKGYPPTAQLLLTGVDVGVMEEINVVSDMDSVMGQRRWTDQMLPFTIPLVSAKGHLIGIPISIHNENWAWYNLKIYNKLKLKPPKTWAEFIAQAPTIAKAGYLPIAVSDSNFAIRILFSVVLAGSGGKETYLRFYQQNDPKVVDTPAFQKVLEVLTKLRVYATPKNQLPIWSDATRAVMKDRAAMQIMGDWAKGEFLASGLLVGRDYQCSPAPDAQDIFLAAVDMAIFPRTQVGAEQDGQRLLAQVILNPKNQLEFARKKGSVPAVKVFNSTKLDACAQSSLALLNHDADRLYSPRMLISEAVATQLQQVVADFWKQPNMPAQILSTQLKSVLTQARKPAAR